MIALAADEHAVEGVMQHMEATPAASAMARVVAPHS